MRHYLNSGEFSYHDSLMVWSAAILLTLVIFWQVIHLAAVLSWSEYETQGARYYARPLAWRKRFRRTLRLHAALLAPILWILGKSLRTKFSQRCIRYEGVAGPAGACSAESFRRAAAYEPRPEDVFVVTQMRSGTTWMQHLVYQVVTRGRGDLPGEGASLNAISPWIESLRTVAVEDAPLVGEERPTRIVKTHLPAELCPYERRAKYIYVARHPLACFASCVDFVRGNLQGFAPDWDECAHWFRSDELMWWGTWVTHVGNWQARAADAENVLLVRYEDMACDLAAEAERIARFLDLRPLSLEEVTAIVAKCRLKFMRHHTDVFEMHPPHLLQSEQAFFRHGGKDRSQTVPPEIAARILAWCHEECVRRRQDIDKLYPDLAEEPSGQLIAS
jgi:hypothetical protein